jgi:hypothetical protein
MGTAEVAIYPFPATKSSMLNPPLSGGLKSPEKAGFRVFLKQKTANTGKYPRNRQNRQAETQ